MYIDGKQCKAPHICQCLGRILTVRGNTTFTISGDRKTSGQQFVSSVLSLAGGLTELGVARGDVVVVASLNSEWYMQWLLAIAFVGGIAAPLNYRWSLDEARAAVEAVKPMLLVVDESCTAWAADLQDVPSIKYHLLIGGESLINIIFACSSAKATNACEIKTTITELMSFDYLWAPKDIALICFTSGTTGRPKAVALSHMSLIVQALAKITIVGYGADDVYLHTAPLFHIGGLSSCIAVLLAGGCHVFIPKFDAEVAAWAIEQNHVTCLITVPAIMADLISVIRRHTRNCGGGSVKKVLNGGGGLPTELVSGSVDVFPHAKIISAYGLTEACSSLTFLLLHDPISTNIVNAPKNNYDSVYDPVRYLGGTCVGKPPSHIELQIQSNNKDGNMPNAGVILTRGAHVMVGYWDHTATTKKVVSPSNWLETGDIGWIDADGDLWLMGRAKDRIKSGGENVYPEEVEAVLAQHPGVLHVLVFGIPDRRLTEMVVACVCLRENWEWIDENKACSPNLNEVSREILQNHCIEKKLTRFKMPKLYIPWWKPFPYTTTGKLKREEVRMEVLSYVEFLPSNL